MSRRFCPREEEGMAWGRGRWGCMAPERKRSRGIKEASRREEIGGDVWQVELDCASATVEVCFVFLAQLAPLLITSYTSCRLPPFTSCFFATVLCFQTSADWLKALFTFALHYSLLLYRTPHTLSLRSNNPWISLLQEGSSSSSTTAPAPHSLFRTVLHVTGDHTFQQCLLCCLFSKVVWCTFIEKWSYLINKAFPTKGHTLRPNTHLYQKPNSQREMNDICIYICNLYFQIQV